MHYITLFFFLIGSLFPKSEVCELQELPELYAHYQDHQAEDPAMGFWDFLALHYADSDHRRSADHDHLPLYHTDHGCHFIGQERAQILKPGSTEPTALQLPLYRGRAFTSGQLEGIFRPPRA